MLVSVSYQGHSGSRASEQAGWEAGVAGGSQQEVPWLGIATPYLSTQTTLTIWFFWLNLQHETLGRISGVGLPALCMMVGSRVISFPRRL